MVSIGDGSISAEDMFQVLFEGASVDLHSSALERVEKSFHFLEEFSRDKVIYGINTGFGPMAQYRIDEEDQIDLQYNLIRSHASGSGKPLDPLFIRAILVARANTLALGKSGVHRSVLELLVKMLERDVLPVIHEHGGVGASGDLVQLAHVALGLIGEGKAYYKGTIIDMKEAFEKEGLEPITIRMREGLGVLNGTSAMTGIGFVNISLAERALDWSIHASSIINELVGSFDDHFSEGLNRVKLHSGQGFIAEKMRTHLSDSGMIRNRRSEMYDRKPEDKVFKEKVQEYYSLRCVPQVLGPVKDTLDLTKKVLIDEVNSVNDNPVIDPENEEVFHGGNFHGDQVSLEMDKMKIAVTKMSMLAERQLNFLLNDKLNERFPPFLNMGKLGFNFGLQGSQYTATSTVAENQTLSNSQYVHSIPNNNDNQDIVSMGSNSALIAGKVVENTFEVLAVQYLGLIQAIGGFVGTEGCSSKTRQIYKELSDIVGPFQEDLPTSPKIRKLAEHLKQKSP